MAPSALQLPQLAGKLNHMGEQSLQSSSPHRWGHLLQRDCTATEPASAADGVITQPG